VLQNHAERCSEGTKYRRFARLRKKFLTVAFVSSRYPEILPDVSGVGTHFMKAVSPAGTNRDRIAPSVGVPDHGAPLDYLAYLADESLQIPVHVSK
jgi:hypothetical protein